jgi:branched-chain amino acid transport system permease protein
VAEPQRSPSDRRLQSQRALRQQSARVRQSVRDAVGRVRETVAGDLSPVTKRVERARAWTEERRWTTPVIGAALVLIAAALPFLAEVGEIPLWLERATSGGTLSRVALFILFALGLNVVVGFAGLLDLGYVAFWAIGAYAAAILTGAGEYTEQVRQGTVTFEDKPEWAMWMWLIFFAILVIGVIAGIVLGSPTLRLRGDYLAIVTLGFGEIVRITANNLDNVTGGPQGISSIPHPEIQVGGVSIVWGTLIDVKYYWLLLAFVVMWIVAIHMLDRSRIGRAWVAIREDEIAAASMGVPVLRMKLAAFVIGACTAGVGGAVYAEQVNFINPQTFDILQSILILSAVVVGGMGSTAGAILGAALVVLLPEVFRGFEDYRYLVFGLALIVVMVFRPQGLLPSRRRKAELLGGTREERLFDAAQTG